MEIVLAGGSGFVGSRLIVYLKRKGYRFSLIGRKDIINENIRHIVNGKDIVVNLIGEPITGRWTRTKMGRYPKRSLLPLCPKALRRNRRRRSSPQYRPLGSDGLSMLDPRDSSSAAFALGIAAGPFLLSPNSLSLPTALATSRSPRLRRLCPHGKRPSQRLSNSSVALFGLLLT